MALACRPHVSDASSNPSDREWYEVVPDGVDITPDWRKAADAAGFAANGPARMASFKIISDPPLQIRKVLLVQSLQHRVAGAEGNSLHEKCVRAKIWALADT